MLQIKNFVTVTGIQVGVSSEHECSLTIRYRAGTSSPEQESPLFVIPRDGLRLLLRQLQDVAAALQAMDPAAPGKRH